MEDAALSPIRRQYLELKRRRPDAILLFRLGDFYETFEEDAALVARVLDITLTSREMGRGERLPMAGIPAHAADAYIGRLIGAGYAVAIAEQVGVVGRNGLMPREIDRVLTPGMLLETDLLSGSRSNFLACVVQDSGGCGLAYVDVSTGELRVSISDSLELLAAELIRIGPAECLISEEAIKLEPYLPPATIATKRSPALFAATSAARAVTRCFGGAPDATGLRDHPLALRALGALLSYVEEARPAAIGTLRQPRLYSLNGAMVLDRATRRNLDLLEAAAGNGGPTLLGVLDRTHTPMGARMLRAVVGQPLLDPAAINARLDAVARLVDDAEMRSRLGESLRGLPDLERLAVRAGQHLLMPRECLALAAGLERIPRIRRALAADLPRLLEQSVPPTASEAAEDIRATIREGATIFEEGVIRPGISDELDQHREMAGDARKWIAALEQRERERTGVRGARVGYNKIFGYYLEVTTAQCAQPTDYYQRQATGAATVGDHLARLGWTRKQTLSNAERFVTPELKEMESRVARAHDDAMHLERALYNALLRRLAAQCQPMAEAARCVALLDVVLSLADAAVANQYVRPIVDEGDCIEIIEGRHPVVEQSLARGQFVANDTRLNADERMMLLTGPNMAGKSTYLRQVALIVLMGQIGSFVPARSARMGAVDRIFTRIGAHDEIAAGRSTFMVEMIEAATIVRAATERSLVVLDEIGRGTSTFDGMAIAQAILEELHDPERPGGAPKTIFATHYHELTALRDTLPHLRTYRVDVLERGDDVVFLHAVVEGGADRSYGVHVARLAGVPERVTRRAATLLHSLEAQQPVPVENVDSASCDTCRELRALDVLAITPLQAQAELMRLQQRANER
ncbi:MAG: DNA mismatch repair protein MutS [Chloroflexi bacterium]|nr:DNA mismatch repair protein MutS [Chloroflexota bacterium]